jgi:hypothetical protein
MDITWYKWDVINLGWFWNKKNADWRSLKYTEIGWEPGFDGLERLSYGISTEYWFIPSDNQTWQAGKSDFPIEISASHVGLTVYPTARKSAKARTAAPTVDSWNSLKIHASEAERTWIQQLWPQKTGVDHGSPKHLPTYLFKNRFGRVGLLQRNQHQSSVASSYKSRF